MRTLPAIEDMMEELADQVLAQMNRQAVTGFKSSLREMVDFHKFLIATHTTQDNGKAFSFAQISDGWAWGPPYKEWSEKYIRLIDKAAELIDADNTFIAYLSGLPSSLLPRSYKDIPPEMVTDLLGLSCHLVWKMEGWVSNRRVDYLATFNRTLPPPMEQTFTLSVSYPEKINLSGTDINSYERALERVISGWENILSNAHYFYDWKKAKTASPDVYWEHLFSSWLYLEGHLKNTAYMLAACVWNNDPIGAKDYASAILRWSDKAVFYMKNHDYFFQSVTLITADIMKDEWSETQKLALPYTYHEDRVDPASVMTRITKNAHRDSIMVASGILVGWHMNGKPNSHLPLKIAKGILDGSLAGEGSQFEVVLTDFSTFMLNLVRIFSSGKYAKKHDYKGTLDEWVRKLDEMSERRIIPGRTYSPSTKTHCEDLIGAWTLCALALFSETPLEADGFKRRFGDLVENEQYFPNGDIGLRSLKDDLSRMLTTLGQIEDKYFLEAIAIFAPKVQEIQKGQFSNLLSELIELIERKRLERIRERAIDTTKIESFKEAAVTRLISYNEKRRVFEDVKISRSQDRIASPLSFRIANFSKGQLVIPAMDYEPSDYGLYSQRLHDSLYGEIVRQLLNKIKCVEDLDSKDDFWRKIKEQAEHIEKPALYVGRWFGYQDKQELINNDPYNFGNCSGKNIDLGGAHLCTLGNVEVFCLNSGEMLKHYNVLDIPQPKAILFSLSALERVVLHEMENGDIAEVFFEESEGDPWHGILTFKYSPEFIWRNSETFEFSYPAADQSADE